MNKFRKWFFKLVFGHDLIEYMDVLNQWGESIEATKSAHEMNDRLIKANGRTIELASKIHDECERLLERLNANDGRRT